MSYGKRQAFYHSAAWKRSRRAYIAYRRAIDGGMCEVCHNQIGDTVHHKIWLTNDNVDDQNIALSFENFCLICRDCHAKEKDPKCNPAGRYIFDSEGNIEQA